MSVLRQRRTTLRWVHISLYSVLTLLWLTGSLLWAYLPWLDTPQTTQASKTKPLPGFLIVHITPKTAQLSIDAKRILRYTQGLALAPGVYTAHIQAPGFVPQTQKVRVFDSDATVLRVKLKPLPVHVRVTSRPSSAHIFFNQKPIGLTPLQGMFIPRWIRVKAQRKGFISVAKDILIPAQKKTQIHILLGGAKRLFSHRSLRVEMHWIPGRYFERGSDAKAIQGAVQLCKKERKKGCRSTWFSAEIPRSTIWLDSFWLDAFEVQVQEYQRCVQAGVCAPFRFHQKPSFPVVGVRWNDARTFCRWRGARLPTEAEWELAAKGPSPRQFPWGNLWRASRSNHGSFSSQKGASGPDSTDGFTASAPVRTFSKGRSPYRIWHLAGNVAEWVEDCFYTSYYRQAPERNPVYRPRRCMSRVIRGGSWMQPAWELRTTARQPLPPSTQSLTVGFRCARSAQSQPLTQ